LLPQSLQIEDSCRGYHLSNDVDEMGVAGEEQNLMREAEFADRLDG
jgi:hypothetical protein